MEKKENKIKDIFTNFRIILLFVIVILSIFALNYDFFYKKGIVINSVEHNSLAKNNLIEVNSNTKQRSLEEILLVNDKKINDVEEFYKIINLQKENSTLSIKTNEKDYFLKFPNDFQNETASKVLGIQVIEKFYSNVNLGIELKGGSRLILKPKDDNLSNENFILLLDILKNRLSNGGLSSTKVSKIDDVFNNEKYILIESTNSNKNQVLNLIERQGEFLAKLDGQVVFRGEDVYQILKREEQLSCNQNPQHSCSYSFSVEIKDEAAENFLNIAKDVSVVGTSLSKKIEFYLDGKKTDELSVSSIFKYKKITTPQITISGAEKDTYKLALEDAKNELKFIQAVLGTKSLPSELEIVSSYTITSSKGEQFLNNAILIGFAALFLVSMIIAIRYRKPEIFIGIFICLLSEIIIIFGIASFLPFLITIDLIAIGGLIAAIGTGVDDQIIITDEYYRKRKIDKSSYKRIKTALKIIIISYFTTIVAMLPLYYAGIDLVKGFVVMIILSVTIGVLITRPAYAKFIRIINTTKKNRLKEDEEENL